MGGVEKVRKIQGLRYLLPASFLMGLMLAMSFPVNVAAEEGDGGKRRYCLIVPPEVKRAAEKGAVVVVPGGADKSGVPAPAHDISFFKGNIGKFGVGAPNCFTLSPQDKITEQVGPNMVYSNLNGYVEALNGDLEIRPFFPSAGYFNRTSRGGKSAVALGVGVKGPGTAPEGEESGGASAGLSLMIGFGF